VAIAVPRNFRRDKAWGLIFGIGIPFPSTFLRLNGLVSYYFSAAVQFSTTVIGVDSGWIAGDMLNSGDEEDLQLRHDVRRAVVPTDVVNGQNVLMVQRGCGARFFQLEALKALGIGRERGRLDLDRHIASEPRIAGSRPRPCRQPRWQKPLHTGRGDRRQTGPLAGATLEG
jgi:hypothetical protein